MNLTIYHTTGEVLRLFGRNGPPAPRISFAPTETTNAILLILADMALFYCAASLLGTRSRRRFFAAVLFSSALVQIVLASLLESRQRVHGIFGNPDHFAGYLEIVLALAFGALWAEVLTNRDRAGEAVGKAERFEKRLPAIALRVLLWGVVAAGIALTQSRGGMLAAGATTIVVLTAAVAHRRFHSHRRAAGVAALALLLGVLFVAVAAGGSRFRRFLETDPRDLGSITRAPIWKTSIAAWRQFPIVGSGLGTFREAFRRVQPREVRGLFENAHNDFLQLAVTGGALGATLGVILFGSIFVLLARAWIRQMHREESAFVLAGVGALLSLTLHGLVEFNLSIPIIPATLACVLGASWSAGRRDEG